MFKKMKDRGLGIYSLLTIVSMSLVLGWVCALAFVVLFGAPHQLIGTVAAVMSFGFMLAIAGLHYKQDRPRPPYPTRKTDVIPVNVKGKRARYYIVRRDGGGKFTSDND